MNAALRPGFVHDQLRLDGKVALINGGRGELAEAFASTLADLGCDVALASRNAEECDQLAAKISRQFGTRAAGLRCDVTQEDEVERLVAEVLNRFGRIDILVNNAGASWWGAPQDIPLSGWKKVVDVNLTGTFLVCRHVARHMIERRSGSIVNIASVGAFLSYRPDAGQVVPYTTTKAAIVHLTSDLAAQWAEHGVRVNAIAPGSIDAGMTATVPQQQRDRLRDQILLHRLGRPEEMAGALALLVSSAGSFITGQTLLVDGGQSIA